MAHSLAVRPRGGGTEVHGELWIVQDLRKLAAVGTAGLLLGFLVGGWGSRLAMMLLARLNPEATGRVSDDGFLMGRFDLADTMNLLLFGTAVGVLGGLVFLAVRQLRFGPRWFRTASMTVGPAVVVGAMLVHTGGVDFRILEPVWLAIALFVGLPGLFAYAMIQLGDRWLRPDSWFMTSRRGWIVGLASLALTGPALILVGGGMFARVLYQTATPLRRLVRQRWVAASARAGLTLIFGLALVDLVRDMTRLL